MALLPALVDTVPGLADSAKSVTLRTTVVDSLWEPLTPAMVRVELPAGVLPVVVMVRVELAPTATEVGLNEAIAPDGEPLTDRLTEPVNEPSAATLTV